MASRYQDTSPTPKLQASPSKRQPTPVDWAREEFFATVFDHIVPQLRMNNKTPPNKLLEQHRNIRALVESVRVDSFWRSPSPAIPRPIPSDAMIHVAPVVQRRTPIADFPNTPEPSIQSWSKSDTLSKGSSKKLSNFFNKMKNVAKTPFRRIARK
ncbi:hypothetical protein Unana1_00066 [Umbelopsis nana]